MGDHVAIYLDKSPGLMVAMLAVMRLGAAYVPLDPDAPLVRNNLLLTESKAVGVIVSESSQPSRILDSKTMRLFIESQDQRQSDQLPPEASRCNMESLATLIFTSGSTGTPKGVQIPQRQLVGYAWTMAEQYLYERGSRVFNFLRSNFDASITEIFGSLVGATVCMTPHQQTLDSFPELMRKMRISNVSVTSSIASLLDPSNLPHLKQLTLAGEAINKTLIDSWARRVNLETMCTKNMV